jgi:hypothetical protein
MRSLVYEIIKNGVTVCSTFSWAEAEAKRSQGCTYRTRLVNRREKESDLDRKWTTKRFAAMG